MIISKKLSLLLGGYCLGTACGIAGTWYIVHGSFPLQIIATGVVGALPSIWQGCR